MAVAVTAALASGAVAQQAGALRGTVYDRDFQAPIAEAQVSIVETGQRTTTDDTGTWSVGNLRPGKYTLVFAKDGYVRQVRSDVVVTAGQLAEVAIQLAGDFTDLEPIVVKDMLRLGSEGEAALLDLRLESPALMNTISSELMSRAGASDAAAALRLVSGASLQNGKTAVIRGLPDRYVSSQLNGVRLPSADEDKRAVELDQFPADVISSVQVTKTFTPDQQGDASGGAVDVRLRGVPEQPFFARFGMQTTHNTQSTGRSRFLTYDGGGINYWGSSASSRAPQELGENWDGAVGVREGDAPLDYRWTAATGGRVEIAKGVRLGGFANLFYERDSVFFDNGIDDSYRAEVLGEPLTPAVSSGAPTSGAFETALLDVTQGTQIVQWGGLGTIGIETDDHALTLAYLLTNSSEDTATLAEDTRGKQYFFPGYDPDEPTTPGHEQPDAAPYLRYQTLEFTERFTDSLQLAGRHRIPLWQSRRKAPVELDWTIARSSADRDQPDKRLFAASWVPDTYRPLKPAAAFTLGNLQRTYKKIEEDSEQYTVGLKLPFTQWSGQQAYVKTGWFLDTVDRKFDQDTFSNLGDNSFFPGRFDEQDWTDVWQFQDHPILAADTDVDYVGTQRIEATYAMLELPLAKSLRLIGGARFESTDLTVVNDPESGATWLPPGQFAPVVLLPGEADVDQSRNDVLPSIGLIHEPIPGMTVRLNYSETLARQTFKEATPILNQEYVGGPVFVGNPDLVASNLRNYDVRVDYGPQPGTFLSASWFRKDIENPIEYVEKAGFFTFTTPVNYPRGQLSGVELEARQSLDVLADALTGLSVGGNGTWMDAFVRLPEDEILLFESVHGVRPRPIRDMTSAPDYLYNLFLTYDLELTGTQFGLFYTVQGDTLVTGPGPASQWFVPATYRTRFDTLNLSFSQRLGEGITFRFTARNLTNAEQEEVYRSEFIDGDVLRRNSTLGVEYSFSITGEFRF
jgi:TonB-dependent receptor